MNTNPDQEPGSLRKKDKKFLDDTIKEIQINLENQDYSVDELANNMNISRSQLYNKIHSATGLSPKTLIRNIRLEEAKTLLERGDLNVSEISHKVGFSSDTYFNTCFRDYFGYPPGEIHKIKSESLQFADRLDHVINKNSQKIQRPRKNWSLVSKIAIALITVLVTTVVLIDILINTEEDYLPGQSIAILPFDNAGSDESEGYLVDGITHAILDKLARLEQLKVISLSSAARYKDSDTGYSEIGDELGATYILTGDIQKSGEKVIINVQLTDAKGEESIWQKTYDNSYLEIFNMHSDIAQSVADLIDVDMNANEQKDINKPQTLNIESYDQFQRGLPYFSSYVLNKRPEDFKTAMEHFSRALAIDFSHAQVYPHVAQLLWLRDYRRDYYRESFMDTVRMLCEKAIDLDPNIPFAHCVLGQYYWETGKPVKGISSLEKAISLNNSYEEAHFYLGFYYSWMGEWEKGLPHLLASVELDPFSVFLPIRYNRIGVVYMDIGDFDKADLYASRALDLTGDNNPASSSGYFIKTQSRIVTGRWEEALEYSKKLMACSETFGLRYLAEITSHYLKNYDEAIRLFERLTTLDPYQANYRQRYAYALWMKGKREKANELFDQQIAEYEKGMMLGRIGRHDPRYNLAGIQAFRGNTKAAMDLLEDYQFQSGLEYYVTIDPVFENLWSNPEFQKLIKKVREEKSKIRARISEKYPDP